MYATVPTMLPGSVNNGLAIVVSIDGSIHQRVHGLGETEIENLRTARSEKNVCRFDVAMHDALGVRGVQGIGDGERDVDEGGGLERPAPEPLLERLAFEQLHRDERRIGTDVVARAAVRMVERRRGARFAAETFHALRRRRGATRQNLDGHDPIEARVLRPIHFAHPAGTEQADDFVGTEAADYFFSWKRAPLSTSSTAWFPSWQAYS